MQYVDFVEKCAPSELKIVSGAPLVTPADKVKVKVHAFGVNRADTLQRAGRYPPPKGESPILGLEVAGEVIEVGAEVGTGSSAGTSTGSSTGNSLGMSNARWQPGDRVFGLVAGGGYATEVVVHPEHLMAVPKDMPMTQAAGLAEVFLTAFQSMRFVADVQPGQTALIHAGASGVGLAALQLCRMWGVNTATTASSAEKLDICRQAGANVLINYREQNFAEVVKAELGSVNFVLDMIGGDYLNRNLACLAQDGAIVYLALMAGRYADQLDMAMLLAKRARILGSTLRNRSDEYKAELIRAFSEQCLPAFSAPAVSSGSNTNPQLYVPIDSVLSINEIGLAHEKLETNATTGKVVVRWDN